MSTTTPSTATSDSLFNLDGNFFVGANYWASHAGTAMWSDWRPEQVDIDLQRLAAAGLTVLRVFPLWPDFQPIHNLYSGRGAHAGHRFGEQRLPDTEAGRAGMSEAMMARFDEFTRLADRHGIRLIVGLVTGWMSGRLFVPPALMGKNVLTDPDAIRWQVRFVSYFVKAMKHQPAIVAWDLGNECNEMGQLDNAAQAYVWTAALANAIKAQDSTRLLLSGMHVLTPLGNWTAHEQGELTDVLTTHPYPFWTAHLDLDRIDGLRATVHATAESLFYAGLGGKPCFAEEMGSMGPMVASEAVAAAFARTSLFTQWSHGLPGMLWWCANDQTRLQTAPYDWTACEGELGLMTEDGRVKPVLQEIGRLKALFDRLPTLPPRRVDAVCILNSQQDHWATALGAFMLARQAGFDIEFRYENQALPDAGFYLLPCVTGVAGVNKPLWEQLLAKVRDGATLYTSSNNGYYLNFAEATGLRVLNRSRRSGPVAVTLEGAGEAVSFELSAPFRLDYAAERAEVLAREADGNPVLSRADHGQGQLFYCALPVELHLAQTPGLAEQPEAHPLWRVYEAISASAREHRALHLSEPNVGVTEHELADGELVAVLVNHGPQARQFDALPGPGWRLGESLYGPAADGTRLSIAGNEAVVIRLHPAEPLDREAFSLELTQQRNATPMSEPVMDELRGGARY